MSLFLFWACASLLVYVYLGYPLLLWLRASQAGKRPEALPAPEALPTISILLSVYNEEAVLHEKIENFLAMDYPSDRLELIVVSDASTDNTDAILQEAQGGNVRFYRQEGRLGKTAAINLAASKASGEILLFTDADSMFLPDAARRLAAHFSDATVGLVSGCTRYLLPGGQESHGSLYVRYELFLRERESRLYSIVGADGAIYALRACLFRPLPARFINDFLHPMQAVLAGYAAVSEPAAVCLEQAEDRGTGEFHRQTRILAQSWDVYFAQMPGLLSARRFGYCWQLTSHKALRWLTVPLLATSTLAGLALCPQGTVYIAASAAQLGFLALALAGIRGRSGLPRVAYLFMLVNLAALNGFVRFVRGERFVTWTPRSS